MALHKDEEAFCAAFLQSMDPERAAADAHCSGGGFLQLGRKGVQNRLDRMRGDAACQLRREDVLRKLAQLAFGRVNDAAALALRPDSVDPQKLDLSAVAELKVLDKGVELRFVDRVKALETLCGLLEASSNGEAQALYQALEDAAGQLDWEA